MATQNRTILVAGATGRQGQALIRNLLHAAAPLAASVSSDAGSRASFSILALTRDASSPTAQRLIEQQGVSGEGHGVTLVEGDLDDPASIRKIFENAAAQGGPRIWGVFAVLAYPGLGQKTDVEEKQGKLLADLALEFRVQAFVYSSTIQPGPTSEPDRDHSHRAKWDIEVYCQGLGAKGLNWIILRPGFFMENFDGFLGSIAVTILYHGLRRDTTIAVVASEDIGRVAAGIFRDHERFLHKIVSVTSGVVTMTEIIESYKRATNKSMPAVPAVLGKTLLRMNSGSRTIVKEIERNHEARNKGEYPEFASQVELAQSVCELQTYFEWKSKTATEAKEKQERPRDWNKLSFLKLLTGRS